MRYLMTIKYKLTIAWKATAIVANLRFNPLPFSKTLTTCANLTAS